MTAIRFGTDGWRAIIAREFTVDNVVRVAWATGSWLRESGQPLSAVVGYDCRFGGQMFAGAVAKTLASQGVKVYVSAGFVSTPMVSLSTVKHGASVGIVITASHNPPEYNGYKLKGPYGGPLLPDKVAEVERLIPDVVPPDAEKVSLEEMTARGLVETIDMETEYCDHVAAAFDLDAIRTSKLTLAYDAMYGAGQNALKRLLPGARLLHCEWNPSFDGIPPEPILKNLGGFTEFIRGAGGRVDFGFATDGDADRIGVFDGNGDFVDSHHVILLLIKYLHEHKKLVGGVCTAFSASMRIRKLCEHYGLRHFEVKIGFKYICEVMLNNDILLGGEESGGIAVREHIPERDGIWIGLTLLEFMVRTGKTLRRLIDEVYDVVGPFAYERADLHITEAVKNKVIADCRSGNIRSFGKYKVTRTESLDGFKYFLGDHRWLMIRPSGTEPVLRTYAEASSKEEALSILEAGYATLIG